MNDWKDHYAQLESRLSILLDELTPQAVASPDRSVGPPTVEAALADAREFIEVREYGLAYESIVWLLDQHPSWSISGPAAVRLLETALLLGFKTEAAVDARFDRRIE